MFFISLTTTKNILEFKSFDVKKIYIGDLTCTVVIDNFLSKLMLNNNGFVIIESPLINNEDFKKIIFSKIEFNQNERCFEIFKSTLSGRPIYYHVNAKGDFFCSTHINMLRRAGVTIEENTKLLPEFFVYRYVIPPHTLYKNISQIPSGGNLRVALIEDGVEIGLSDEFRPPLPCTTDANDKIDTIATQSLNLLTTSCRRLDPVCDKIQILFSGGLDSSILFMICRELFNLDTTYSTGYPFECTKHNVEKDYAFSAARDFSVRHEYYESSVENYLHGILQSIATAEEPVHHLQSVLLYLLFKNHLQENSPIVICGLGADGILGSDFHERVNNNCKSAKLLSVSPVLNLLKLLRRTTGIGKELLHNIYWSCDSRIPLSNPDNIIWRLGKYGDEQWVKQYFGVSKSDIILNRYKAISSFEDRSLYDKISILSFLGSASVTQGIWSKLGEAHGKILFYPFTETELISHLFSVPWDIKLLEKKNVLREVALLLSIPNNIITKSKASFGIREERWAGRDSVFEPLVSLAAKVIEIEEVRSMQSIQPRYAYTFWNMLNYAVWKRLCIDEEPLQVLEEELVEAICKTKAERK